MRTHESEEMYLETILLIRERKGSVHSVDVVRELDYAKSSVSRAMGLLQEKGYIVMAADGELSLTDAGWQKAQGVYERHRVLTALFVKIGADEKTAEENACRVEHVITDELFEVVKRFVVAK